jgi:hypothetical protein
VASEKAAAEGKENQSTAATEKVSISSGFALKKLAPGKRSHLFLTHNWSDDEEGRKNHDRVSRVNKALQKRGFITWFDEERMSGRIRQTMSEAIYQTSCVVVCITKVYEKKVNSDDAGDSCFFEFDLASRELANHRVPVVMEDCMLDARSWEKGRLRAELGGVLYVDMSKDEEAIFERRCDELAASIAKVIFSKQKCVIS